MSNKHSGARLHVVADISMQISPSRISPTKMIDREAEPGQDSELESGVTAPMQPFILTPWQCGFWVLGIQSRCATEGFQGGAKGEGKEPGDWRSDVARDMLVS